MTMLFRNFGGIHQFVVQNASDLARISSLDPARWAATSAPLQHWHCDPALAQALDPTGSQRLRVGQLLQARDWLFARLRGRDRLSQATEALLITDLDTRTVEGRQLVELAELVVQTLGRGADGLVTLQDVREFRASLAHVSHQLDLPLQGEPAEPPAPPPDALADLERLLLLHRWLIEVTNNVVNFSAIYDAGQVALVDAGSLVIDGRRLEFCLHVADRVAHRQLSERSSLFLVYVQIESLDGDATFDVVAPVTSGQLGRIYVGKRGLFIDREGRQFDCHVVEIVDNPISVAEAMRAPFRKVGAFVVERLEQLSSLPLGKLTEAAKPAPAVAPAGVAPGAAALPALAALPAPLLPTPAPAAPHPPPAPVEAPAKPPASTWTLQNTVLSGGLAFAALGSAGAYALTTLSQVHPLRLMAWLSAILTAVALVAGLLGWLKLHRRDVAYLLEANGWAVNVVMPITRRVGLYFTRVPELPDGHRFERPDALAAFGASEDRQRRRTLVLVLVLIGLSLGLAVLVRYRGS